MAQAEYFDFDDIFEGAESSSGKDYGYLKPGIYPVKVLEVSKTMSKKGNNMIKLKLEAHDAENGKFSTIYWQTPLKDKIVNMAMAFGLLAKGQKSRINWDALNGCEGKAMLKDATDANGNVKRSEKTGEPFNDISYFVIEDDDMEF